MLNKLILAIKQRYCHHLFVGVDLVPRAEDGLVTWPCRKCRKVFRNECGLFVLHHGDASGPWIKEQ